MRQHEVMHGGPAAFMICTCVLATKGRASPAAAHSAQSCLSREGGCVCPRGRVMPCLSFEAYVRRNECFGSFGSWMGRLLDSGFLNSFRMACATAYNECQDLEIDGKNTGCCVVVYTLWFACYPNACDLSQFKLFRQVPLRSSVLPHHNAPQSMAHSTGCCILAGVVASALSVEAVARRRSLQAVHVPITDSTPDPHCIACH